jgi:hypothetical protein
MSLALWHRKRKNTLDRFGIGQFCRPPVAVIHQCVRVCVCLCVSIAGRPAKQVARPLVNQNNNNLSNCGASAAKTRLELGYGNRIIRAVHPRHVAHPAADKSTFQSIHRRPVFTHAKRGCCNVLNCAFHTPPCMPCPVPRQIGSAPKIRDQPMDNITPSPSKPKFHALSRNNAYTTDWVKANPRPQNVTCLLLFVRYTQFDVPRRHVLPKRSARCGMACLPTSPVE